MTNVLGGILGQMFGKKRLIIVLFLLAASFATLGATKAHASGGGCQCFVHTSTSTNTFFDYTIINDNVPIDPSDNVTLTPQSKLFVTAVGISDPHPLGVWYTGTAWAIFNEDRATMPVGVSFNVQINGGYVVNQTITATSSNTGGDSLFLNTLGYYLVQPNSAVEVTAVWGPHDIYDPHFVGVWYTGSTWAIFNEDGSAMPIGATFNIAISPESPITVTSTNSGSDYVFFKLPDNDDSDMVVVVTPNWEPHDIYTSHPFAFEFFLGYGIIINADGAPMPLGASFNVQYV